ncbi:1-deoxy-D-xylulose-5-phosphate synthase [compost metagenome]
MYSIKPIDKQTIIKSAKETRKLISIEDHSIIGGLGTAITEVLCDEYPSKLERMGIKDTFGRSGKAEELMKYFKITAEDIINKFN